MQRKMRFNTNEYTRGGGDNTNDYTGEGGGGITLTSIQGKAVFNECI